MTSRLVRGIVLTVGAGALATTAFTQAVTPPPASTIQQGAHATYKSKPITVGLIPAIKPTPKATTPNDADQMYDYINPCSLVPLNEIHTITGDYRLKFMSQNGLTSSLSRAAVARNTEEGEVGQVSCFLTNNLNSVKAQLMIGIVPDVQKVLFEIRFRQWNNDDNKIMWAERVPTRGLPGVDSAYMTYAVSRGERHYQQLFVHTKAGQTLEVLRPNKAQLRQLAAAALRTLDGSRYPGK